VLAGQQARVGQRDAIAVARRQLVAGLPAADSGRGEAEHLSADNRAGLQELRMQVDNSDSRVEAVAVVSRSHCCWVHNRDQVLVDCKSVRLGTLGQQEAVPVQRERGRAQPARQLQLRLRRPMLRPEPMQLSLRERLRLQPLPDRPAGLKESVRRRELRNRQPTVHRPVAESVPVCMRLQEAERCVRQHDPPPVLGIAAAAPWKAYVQPASSGMQHKGRQHPPMARSTSVLAFDSRLVAAAAEKECGLPPLREVVKSRVPGVR
jgi:hypothetical protein